MDIFKQKRYLTLLVIVLIIFNLTAITMLWLCSPKNSVHPPRPGEQPHDQKQLRGLLKKELNFDEEQIEKYLKLHRSHREKVDRINAGINHVKRQMFDAVLQDEPRPMLSDSLLQIAQEKQAEIERMTFQYFLDLKQLCRPEQRDKLKILMHEVFRKRSGPPPPREKSVR